MDQQDSAVMLTGLPEGLLQEQMNLPTLLHPGFVNESNLRSVSGEIRGG